MSRNSYLTPTFTPFQSGCSKCKPSTDYYSQPYVGGGNYSNDSLIPTSNGKNFYKVKDFHENLDNEFISKNKGIDYATSFGGSKGKSKISKEKKTKPKAKKGGFSPIDNSPYIDSSSNINEEAMNNFLNIKMNGGLKNKKTKKGGFSSANHSPYIDSKASNIFTNSINVNEELIESPLRLKMNGGLKDKKTKKGGFS